MTRCVQMAVLTGLMIAFTPAAAAAGFWDLVRWVNDMSGPKMTGGVFEIPVWCHYRQSDDWIVLFDCTRYRIPSAGGSKQEATAANAAADQKRRIPETGVLKLSDLDRRDWTVGFRFGRLTNVQRLGNEQTVREISVLQFGPAARYSLHDTVEVVGSFQFVRFQGPTVDEFWVRTLDAGVLVRPFGYIDLDIHRISSRLGHVFGASVRYTQFFGSFAGERFGAPRTFESTNEGVWQLGLSIDATALFWPSSLSHRVF